MLDLFEYKDYDLQTSFDSRNIKKLQIVGIRNDGQKVVLKEFEHEISFVGFSPKTAYAAADEKKSGGLKMGGAFILGTLIGGVVVYLIMRNKMEAMTMVVAPPAEIQPPMVSEPIPMRPEADMAAWMHDYDNDIFTRGE